MRPGHDSVGQEDEISCVNGSPKLGTLVYDKYGSHIRVELSDEELIAILREYPLMSATAIEFYLSGVMYEEVCDLILEQMHYIVSALQTITYELFRGAVIF